MLKTEVLCQSCDQQFILVTVDEIEPTNCPFCTSPLPVESDLDFGGEEE